MLKKYYLAFFLLIYFSKSYASFWDGVAQCLTNPCNCGYSPIDEIWNETIKRKGIEPNSMCPPWNKRDGRDTDNCLVQFNPPENFIGFYLHHCAEHTTESSYFAPKIRIRTQSCNAFACWNQSTTLNWDGECVIWPGAYALPLLRICARVAVPAVAPTALNSKGTPADPGYTLGKHLNDVGFTEDDKPIIGDDGKPIVGDDGKPFNRPKLCAYSDPGLVNLVSATGVHLDPMDWNPIRQPLHKTDELHPFAKILKFLIDIKSSMSISVLLGKLLDMIASDNTPGLDVIKEIVKWIGYIFEQQWMYEVAKKIVEALGALNRSVDDYQFGCVELPFGPFPPPYCPKLEQFIITPTTKLVCSKKKNGLFVQSSDAPCVVSKLRNNLIHNVVRVSLDNLVPLCRNKENPQETDKCVRINNLDPFSSAQGIHSITAQRDAIKKCSIGDVEPCVNTKIPFECSITENGCEDGFRIVYTQKVGDISTPSSYYVDDLPDCNSEGANGKITCQEIWGINIGEFIDVNLAFPSIQGQDGTSLLPLKKTFKLRDNVGDRSFVASITRNTTLKSHLSRDPKSICVAEGDSLVGCEDRVTDGYQILTYQCEGFPGITCHNNSYYNPQFIASIRVSDDKGNIVDSTSTVITPLSASNPIPIANKTEEIINLAGYNFTSFMAYISNTPPTIYTAMPFSGTKSMNPLTIYGNYKDDKTPYDAKGIPTTGVVYLKGLEYINGKYIQGATHGCLQLKDIDKCVPGVNNTNCVLAKLLESDTVDCSKFKTKSMQYLGLQICQDTHTGCNSAETIDDLKTKGITIYKCANSAYCYKNNRKSDVEVCKVSVDSNNRIDPSLSLGPTINTDEQHYTAKFNEQGILVDKDGIPLDKTAAIRDKTPQELGFCTSVPAPKCQAITTPTNASGNATWSSTKIGDLALGTCKPSWVLIDPNKPLQRYCLSNIDTKTVAFEGLPDGVGCKENTGLNFKYTSDKKDFPVKNSYDNATKVGTFVLGGPYGSAAHTYDAFYCVNYEFDIPNTNMLSSFTIGGNGSYYDDYIMIKVNNQLINTGPDNFNSMECRNYNADRTHCDVYISINGKFVKASDIGRANNLAQLNLMSHLQNGKNNINTCVGIVGGGTLNVTIKYQLK
ncbi:MAG: hypothetical protein LBE72_06825 [Rickettsia sp.]|nr:hypothetical protein [Rickettsia sp.]